MAEPTLHEITNIVADPERGSGTPAVVLDGGRSMIANLNQNARFKAENDWRKYNLFLGNLKDAYKEMGDIASMEIATQDREELRKRMGQVFEGIAKDPKSFFSGGPNFQKINEEIVKLKADATESKMNRMYDYAHREYINRNPELNTPDNKSAIESFWQQPLGKRKAYMLNMPTIFDISSYAKGIMDNPAVSKSFAESKPVGDDGSSPGKTFVRNMEGLRYDRGMFMSAWNAGLNTAQDKYGHSIHTWAQQQFDALPDDQKKKYGNVETFWNELGKQSFSSDKDILSITKDELKPNTQAYEKEKLGIQQERNNIAWSKLHEVDKPKAEAQIKRWGELSHGTETQKTQAVSFAANIYSQIKALADKDGVITPDKIRQMTAEQLKYLGIEKAEKRDTDGKVLQSKGFEPMVIEGDEIIQLDNGKIKVMKGAKQSADGRWHGQWDPTRTTTTTNIATNRLNEELKTAGSKELNTYIGIDSDDGASDDGAGTTETKETTDEPAPFSTKGLTPVKKGSDTYYVDPKTRKVYNSKGKELK